MTLEGTVVNGQVVFGGAPKLPEGFVVRAEFIDPDDELDVALDGMPVPPPTETYEEHLALLRQSVADAKAGIGLMTLEGAMAELDAELQRLMEHEATPYVRGPAPVPRA